MNKVGLLVPTSERIYDKVVDTLNNAGIYFSGEPSNRSYRKSTNISWLDIILKKDSDIPITLLSSAFTVAGFVGYDWIREIGLKERGYGDFIRLVDTGIAPCKMVVAGPEEIYNSLDDLRKIINLRVGSSYPYTAEDYLRRICIKGTYVERRGTIEGMPDPDLSESDVIVDLEATGDTLILNRLKRIQEMFDSNVGLYTTTQLYRGNRSTIDTMGRRVQEAVSARKKIWLEANVPAEILDQILANMPAMKSPTIAQLGDRSGFGVKSVVNIEKMFELIGELEGLGAQDIVTYPLQSVGIQGTYVPRQLSEEDLQH